MKLVISIDTAYDAFRSFDGKTVRHRIVGDTVKQIADKVAQGEYEGTLPDLNGNRCIKWHLRPVSHVSPERAQEILKQGSATFGNYSKFCTEEEDHEIRRMWASNKSGSSSFYSTLCRIAAGDYTDY